MGAQASAARERVEEVSAQTNLALAVSATQSIADRIEAFDWQGVSRSMDERGSAIVERLLSLDECRSLAALYPEEDAFRSRVVMERHGFGRGEYKYFAYPLPNIMTSLRSALYSQLVPTANRWNGAMGIAVQYPAKHADFLARCHAA